MEWYAAMLLRLTSMRHHLLRHLWQSGLGTRIGDVGAYIFGMVHLRRISPSVVGSHRSYRTRSISMWKPEQSMRVRHKREASDSELATSGT